MSANPKQNLTDLHVKYIKQNVIPEVIACFKNEDLENVEIEKSVGLDGFMSALYNIRLKTILNESNTTKERFLIAKFMKGDEAFRENSKSYIQFANEIFIYGKVLPIYSELLMQANIADVSVENWIAHCYQAKFGFIEGLSATPAIRESALVLENLKPRGYTLGPRLYLRRDHLLSMASTLGQYHAMSYVLRYHDVSKFESLLKEIVPFPFIEVEEQADAKPNLYAVLYRVAFDRFFEYFDRIIEKESKTVKVNVDEENFLKNVQRLRENYFKEPTKLLEWFRISIEDQEKDKRFGVILHGDFNRNNVLFRYKNGNGDDNEQRLVEDAKLIDFQEMRYGSPAMDISFFMYFNTPELLRDQIWFEILKCYHSQMLSTLSEVLYGLKTNDDTREDVTEYLQKYSFEDFNVHFSRYAFYGVMICLHFLPWCFSTEEECGQLSHYFETDMHGEEFYKISMTAGGDEANERILNIVKHASKMGYMDDL